MQTALHLVQDVKHKLREIDRRALLSRNEMVRVR